MPKVTDEYLDTRKQQIIDAAYRCFARKGYHQATMRDIFAEARLSPGAVYRYFESKDDIIEASFILDHQRSLPIFEQAASDPDPRQALDHIIDFFYAGLESAAEIGADRVNIQGWGEALYNPRLLAALRETFLDFRAFLTRLIESAQAAGGMDAAIDPKAMGELIFSTYLGLYLQKAIYPELDVAQYKSVVKALIHAAFTDPA